MKVRECTCNSDRHFALCVFSASFQLSILPLETSLVLSTWPAPFSSLLGPAWGAHGEVRLESQGGMPAGAGQGRAGGSSAGRVQKQQRAGACKTKGGEALNSALPSQLLLEYTPAVA